MAADHADAGPVSEHIGGGFRINPADYGDTAAVEFGEGVAGGAENPQLGPAVVRVPLGHGQAAGADRTGDKDLAVGHRVTGAVAGITKDSDLRADIQVAEVIRSGSLTEDRGARHAHAAETLAGWAFDDDTQAFRALQADTDIMLPV